MDKTPAQHRTPARSFLNPSPHRRGRMIGFLVASLTLANTATAQIETRDMLSLLIDPWLDGPHWAETIDRVEVVQPADHRGQAGSTDAFRWDSFGKIKPNRESDDPHWTIGYRVLSLTFDSDLPAINGSPWTIALAGGYQFGDPGDEWRWGMIGGAGHANDGHFNDDDGWYGLATINVTRQLDETRRLHLGLAYHGNRLILPDIPLPYITYTHRDDQVTYAIGLPSTWVAWTAVENLTVEAAYLFPMDGEVRVEYRLGERFRIFAEYLATTDGWSIDGVDHRRMFYEFHRASAGVRWVSQWIDASLGIGYAFDQRFETGFDIRHTTHIVALEDEPLVSLRLTGTF